jgi:hypothetical protein
MCDKCPKDLIEAITTLRANLQNLSPGDLKFAGSLLSFPQLSDKQAIWVKKLAVRALHPEVTEKAKALADASKMQGVIALFEKAATHLKFPAVILSDKTIGEIKLFRAGARAKIPGSVTVVGKESKEWIGRIKLDGVFEFKAPPPETLIRLLEKFAAKPAEIASEYGKLTGRCCFCYKGLTDQRSTDVGYGPICAEHYHLPWGKVA